MAAPGTLGVIFFNRTNTIAEVKIFRRIIWNYPILDEEVRDVFTNYCASNTAERVKSLKAFSNRAISLEDFYREILYTFRDLDID